MGASENPENPSISSATRADRGDMYICYNCIFHDWDASKAVAGYQSKGSSIVNNASS